MTRGAAPSARTALLPLAELGGGWIHVIDASRWVAVGERRRRLSLDPPPFLVGSGVPYRPEEH